MFSSKIRELHQSLAHKCNHTRRLIKPRSQYLLPGVSGTSPDAVGAGFRRFGGGFPPFGLVWGKYPWRAKKLKKKQKELKFPQQRSAQAAQAKQLDRVAGTDRRL